MKLLSGVVSFRVGALALMAACGACLLPAQAVRVSEPIALKAATKKVNPAYPPMARQMKIAGRVEMDVHVGASGDVEKVEPVTGNPLLTGAATAALKQWKFGPIDGSGEGKAFVTRISFNFERP